MHRVHFQPDSGRQTSDNSFTPMDMTTPKDLQRVELLNYTKADGKELTGLAVELAEDPTGGVQIRVLMDSNVVSAVTVVPLQQGGCCD